MIAVGGAAIPSRWHVLGPSAGTPALSQHDSDSRSQDGELRFARENHIEPVPEIRPISIPGGEHRPFALYVAESSPLVDTARTLVAEYAALPHNAGRWPTPAADIAALPTPYVRPMGVLLVALEAANVAVPTPESALGCGALGAVQHPHVAELKRIYVRPHARGRGIGKAIMVALIEWADSLGFERVRLDTAPELTAALALYRQLGFTPIPPYREGLLPDALCFDRAVRL